MTQPPPVPYPTDRPLADPPLYGANPIQALSRFFRKYATFHGRASRSEFWWVALWGLLVFAVIYVTILVGAITIGDGGGDPAPLVWTFGTIGGVVLLGTIVPGIAVTVRRLHDANLSGLLYLLSFIPSVGGLIVLILAVLPPQPAGARFD